MNQDSSLSSKTLGTATLQNDTPAQQELDFIENSVGLPVYDAQGTELRAALKNWKMKTNKKIQRQVTTEARYWQQRSCCSML